MTPRTIVECNFCRAFVEAESHGAFERISDGAGPSTRFALIACSRCRHPMLISQGNVGNLAEGDIWDTPRRLFPADDYRANPNAPRDIQTAFQEAIACFRARAYAATAIMCRKTIEGLCEVHSVHERNLVASLKEMQAKGLIDERLHEWSDALRIAGNEAAHDAGSAIGEADAADILEFTNAILDYSFSYRDRFEQFKIRRRAKSGSV